MKRLLASAGGSYHTCLKPTGRTPQTCAPLQGKASLICPGPGRHARMYPDVRTRSRALTQTSCKYTYAHDSPSRPASPGSLNVCARSQPPPRLRCWPGSPGALPWSPLVPSLSAAGSGDLEYRGKERVFAIRTTSKPLSADAALWPPHFSQRVPCQEKEVPCQQP